MNSVYEISPLLSASHRLNSRSESLSMRRQSRSTLIFSPSITSRRESCPLCDMSMAWNHVAGSAGNGIKY